MPIRGSIKRMKEGPAQTAKIAMIALFIAITALIVSLGKRISHG